MAAGAAADVPTAAGFQPRTLDLHARQQLLASHFRAADPDPDEAEKFAHERTRELRRQAIDFAKVNGLLCRA